MRLRSCFRLKMDGERSWCRVQEGAKGPREARSVINQSSVSQSVAHEFAPRTKVTRVGGALSLC
jgi:hypothetical protein